MGFQCHCSPVASVEVVVLSYCLDGSPLSMVPLLALGGLDSPRTAVPGAFLTGVIWRKGQELYGFPPPSTFPEAILRGSDLLLASFRAAE